MAVIWCNPIVSLADHTGTVTAPSVNIREKADVNSEVIGSSSQGKKITIKDQMKDSSGTAWYRVYVDGDTLGYIRADLVSTEETVEEVSAAQTDNSGNDQNDDAGASDDGASDNHTNNSGTASGAEVQAENAMDAQYVSVSVQAAKIRTLPSTDGGVVETLAEGKQLIASGKSNGSDGKEWYYVTFTGANGAEKTGFVRSDLVEMGDMLPVEEEEPQEPVEEPEPVENINNDFELRYEQDGDGYVWYLYDNRNSQESSKQKLEPLLEAAEQAMANTTPADTDTVVKQRIIIVVLVVLAVALAVAVIIMAFKLRDVYYEDYEDEDEEDEDEEPEKEVRSSRQKARPAEAVREMPQENERPSRRKSVREEAPVRSRPEKKAAAQEVTYQEEPDAKVAVKTAPKRKAKNFLIDDDDFEFEFLNMDEKDLQ